MGVYQVPILRSMMIKEVQSKLFLPYPQMAMVILLSHGWMIAI